MKKALLVTLILFLSNPLMAVEKSELEKIIRLQNLVSFAKDKGNYDLVCKAQSQIVISIEKAKIADMIKPSKKVFNDYCTDIQKVSLLIN
jgi:hypothetical protein